MMKAIGKNPARHSRRMFAGAALAMLCAISPVAGATDVLDEGDVKEPYSVPKATMLRGAAYDGASVAGIVELKLGKVDNKKKTSKVSGSVTGLDGKKHAMKPFTVADVDGASPKKASLEVKGLGKLDVTIGGGQFAGSLGTFHVQSAETGGNWTKAGSVVNVEVPAADLQKFAGVVVDALLPAGEPVVPAGGKWKFAKAAGVKWAKLKGGAAPFGGFADAASGKGLLVDTSKGANLSGMKLVYTPKKGTFKGTFKVYALEGSGAKTKLKKYTVKVSGVVVDGEGYGEAVCKKPSVAWAANVRASGSAPGQPEHEMVQLWEGGPYWATTNIGAEKPEDYGLYFWWGDTVGYTRSGGTWTDDYYYSGVTWVSSAGEQMSSSPFVDSSCPTYGKDNSALLSAGYIDSTGNLVAAYDAATAHLGAPWRMPTDAEFSALIDNCTTTWITTNGVSGRLVTGKGNYANRSIFLPAAGRGNDSCLYYPGSRGFYWSSTPYSGDSNFAWNLYFSSNFYRSINYRYLGQSVRPVRGFAK